MYRIIAPYIPSILLCLFFIGCRSNTETAQARTSNSGFHEIPVKSLPMPLIYDTLSPQTREITRQLDQFYATQVKAGFNGSVLIGYQGRIIYERFFGYANREAHIPLDHNSSDQLASVSKTFTGAAIMYLFEHKYLDINESVQSYLPEFPYPNITLKMLLSHRSGLADYSHWYLAHTDDFSTPISNNTMLEQMAKYRPALEFRPNSRFKYCNTNYALLAMVIERVTGMTYPEFMNKYIFQPLGMEHTFIFDAKAGLPPYATISYDHNWRRQQVMFADGVFGDKGIYSTTEDMYRWDQSFYQSRLLSNETIELAYGPCSFEKPGVKNYGLGWRMLCFPNGNKVIYHNGWWHGNNTSFYRFIKDNLTIVVLGNRFNNGIYRQALKIFSILKGVPVQKGFDSED